VLGLQPPKQAPGAPCSQVPLLSAVVLAGLFGLHPCCRLCRMCPGPRLCCPHDIQTDWLLHAQASQKKCHAAYGYLEHRILRSIQSSNLRPCLAPQR